MTAPPTEIELPPPVPKEAQPVEIRPSWQGALRGIWLFTWRSQLVWRRLPVQLLMLVILPVLVFLTVPSPRAWSERHARLINADQQTIKFAARLARSKLKLSDDQLRQLLEIFKDESSRLDRSASETLSSEAEVESQRTQLKESYERIKTRAQFILDEKQFAEFRKLADREATLAQGRVVPTWGRTEPFYHWLLDLYFFVVLPLSCVRSSGGLIRDELQADTLGFLVTRPLSRARLVVLKYLTQMAWLQMVLLLETVLLFATGALSQIPELWSLLPLFLAAQVLAVPAWSGLGVLLGQLTKRYLPMALLYGLIVEMGIGLIPTNINTLSLIWHLKGLLAHNSGLQSIYAWTITGVPACIGALLLAAILFVAAAAILFTIREYHHTAEMQK